MPDPGICAKCSQERSQTRKWGRARGREKDEWREGVQQGKRRDGKKETQSLKKKIGIQSPSLSGMQRQVLLPASGNNKKELTFINPLVTKTNGELNMCHVLY